MGTMYEIEGNLITKVERTVSQVGTVSDLLPTLMTYQPIEMGSLPKNTVYLNAKQHPNDPRGADVSIIVQQPPQVREVIFNESNGYEDTQTAYSLAMPYFNFWFRMQGSRESHDPEAPMLWTPQSWGVYWTRRPFQTVEDGAISARMPNMWPDTRVCFGANPIPANLSMGQHIDTLINTYWASVFNTDLEIFLPYGRSARVGFGRWQDATAQNSDCWMNWDIWEGHERPARDLIDQVTSRAAFTTPAPDSTEGVVPEVPIIRTWYALNRWIDESLDEDQRNRLKAALDART